jgi:hypothetical protein
VSCIFLVQQSLKEKVLRRLWNGLVIVAGHSQAQ